jgi:hypothetical protein
MLGVGIQQVNARARPILNVRNGLVTTVGSFCAKYFLSNLAIRLACERVPTHEDVRNTHMPAGGIMKSVLLPELESRRIKIAKVHNLLVCVLLGLLFGLLLIAVLLPHSPTHKPSIY